MPPPPAPAPLPPQHPQRRTNILSRKASFDSKTKRDPSPNRPEASQQQAYSASQTAAVATSAEKSLDPSQVFLHLFQTQHSASSDTSRDQAVSLINGQKESMRKILLGNFRGINETIPVLIYLKIKLSIIGRRKSDKAKFL